MEPLRLRGTVRDRSEASFRGGGAKTAQGSATEHTVECGMKGSTGSAERCGPNAEECGRMGKYQEVQGFWDYLRLLRSPPKNSENARLLGGTQGLHTNCFKDLESLKDSPGITKNHPGIPHT